MYTGLEVAIANHVICTLIIGHVIIVFELKFHIWFYSYEVATAMSANAILSIKNKAKCMGWNCSTLLID